MNTDVYDRDGNPMPVDWWNHPEYLYRVRGGYKRVGATAVGDYRVSTVWLQGIDHNWGDGPPLIFETMVFAKKDDLPYHQELQRYSTEEQAMRGHLDTLDRIRAGLPPFPHLDEETA